MCVYFAICCPAWEDGNTTINQQLYCVRGQRPPQRSTASWWYFSVRSFDYIGLTYDTFSIAGDIKHAFIRSRSQINTWLLMYAQFLYESVGLCVSSYLGGGLQAWKEFWKGMKCQKPSSELVSPPIILLWTTNTHLLPIQNIHIPKQNSALSSNRIYQNNKNWTLGFR